MTSILSPLKGFKNKRVKEVFRIKFGPKTLFPVSATIPAYEKNYHQNLDTISWYLYLSEAFITIPLGWKTDPSGLVKIEGKK
jgi:hypothetical protein